MFKNYTTYFLIGVLALFLQSCGPMINVDVDAISSPAAVGKSKYVLLSGNTDCDPSTLQFIEFSSYTDRALQQAGFTKVSCLEDADVAVFLSYGISDPCVYQYTYSLPVYGQTGVSSSTTYGNVNSFGNMATYSSTTNYTPTYGVIGSTTQVGTNVLYVRYLKLSGVDVEKYMRSEKVEELWCTSAVSSGVSGDIRFIFPVILGASKGYIGKNTGKTIGVVLDEEDQRVLEVKGLVSQ